MSQYITTEEINKSIHEIGFELGCDFTFKVTFPIFERNVCLAKCFIGDGYDREERIFVIWKDDNGKINYKLAIVNNQKNGGDVYIFGIQINGSRITLDCYKDLPRTNPKKLVS